MTTSYFQRSRLGEVTFELDGSRLRVSGKRGFNKIELDVDLKNVSSHFERRKWRSFVMVAFPLGIATITALLALLVPYPPVTLIAGMFTLGFLWAAIRNAMPIELVTFRDRSGVPIFEVIKGERQEIEFEKFIADLTTAIRFIAAN